MSDVSQLLQNIAQGRPECAHQLLPLVYEELRRLAVHHLRRESQQQTLQPTALVHEAYLRLVENGADLAWDSKGHFFSAAAIAMRRILVENARRRRSLKRGGGLARQAFDEELLAMPEPSEDLLALNEALDRLGAKDEIKAKLVQLRYFAGLTIAESAAALGISTATAERYWAYARAWLHQEMSGNSQKRADDE